jgi:acyl carrier protein
LNEEINTKYIETQPAVGVDEKGRETLYFVSDRKEGKGGKDIWYTTYKAKRDEFRTPRNSGSKINSVGDEITPFIDPINGKLYFSSNGHPGYGQFDVYKSSGQRSRWQEPVNLGKPINSAQDESYYVSSPSGRGGVFASNRDHPKKQALSSCCDDLFEFQDPNQIRLSLTGLIKANNEQLEAIPLADLRIYTKDSTEELFFNRKLIADSLGEFELILEPDQEYVIKAGSKNYLTEVKELSTKGALDNGNYQLEFQLEPKVGKSFNLENIYYEFGKAELTEEAFTSIDTTIYEILIEKALEQGAISKNDIDSLREWRLSPDSWRK